MVVLTICKRSGIMDLLIVFIIFDVISSLPAGFDDLNEFIICLSWLISIYFSAISGIGVLIASDVCFEPICVLCHIVFCPC